MIVYNSKHKIYYSTIINNTSFFSGFGTRVLGDGSKVENLIKFFRENKINFNKVIRPGQVHGDRINIICRDRSRPVPTKEKILNIFKTDGIITSQSQIVLTVITADCVPIIFCDKKSGIIGISHQGWKGTYKCFASKMIRKMIDHGSDKNNIKVAVGPSIGDCCYDITQDRYNIFAQKFPKFKEKIFRQTDGKIYMNLSLLNYLQLIDTGIKKENIDFFPFCTSCDNEKFFSYRRDGKKNLKEMFSFIIKQ